VYEIDFIQTQFHLGNITFWLNCLGESCGGYKK
jgi:hypothetical protein